MSSQSPNYRAYLLRLWREHARAPWRASLQSAAAQERLNFASLAALIAFLEQETEQQVGAVPPDRGCLQDSLTDCNL